MPLVYACICPHPPVIVPEVGRGREAETHRTVEALRRVADELASYQPETVLLVSSHGPSQHQAMGLLTAPQVAGDFAQLGAPEVRFAFDTDQELAERIQEEAARDDVRLVALRRWDGGLDWGCTVPLYYLSASGGLAGARLLPMTISWLEPHFHFDLGRAIGRALAGYERRVAFVCSADLSHALFPGAPEGYDPAGKLFDEHYRRAIEAWDVKWLVHLESGFRRQAAEDAVAQTAILMGTLSGYRIQPRVLSYEGPFGVGYLVAAIDVLGPRRKERA
jgi:aromatic ring-opening dioxygenase LigB subunit